MSDIPRRVANPLSSSYASTPGSSVRAPSGDACKDASGRRSDAISLYFESIDGSRHLGPYCQGRASRIRGDAYDSNPYPFAGRLRYFFDRWNEGWLEADLEDTRVEALDAAIA